MKKIFLFLISLGVLYVVAAVVAWLIVSKKIAECQSRLPALDVAVKTICSDREKLSAIVGTYTSEHSSNEKSLDAMLADKELNRIALVYLNHDFALMRREFRMKMNEARSAAGVSSVPQSPSEMTDMKLQQEIKELEHTRHSLANKISKGGFGHTTSSERRIMLHLNDIDNQLSVLRNLNVERKYRRTAIGKISEQRQVTMAEKVNAVVTRYENDTIKKLSATMNTQIDVLRKESEKANDLYEILSWFDFFPLNRLFKLPTAANA